MVTYVGGLTWVCNIDKHIYIDRDSQRDGSIKKEDKLNREEERWQVGRRYKDILTGVNGRREKKK